jgi:hypothetical protein
MPKNIRVPFAQRCPTSDPILADAVTDDVATTAFPRDPLDQLAMDCAECRALRSREEPLFLDGTSLRSRRTYVRDPGPRRRGRVRGIRR